jgi:hypothetical protein
METAHKVSIGACDPGTVNGGWAYRMFELCQNRNDKLGPFVRIKGSGLLSKMRNRVVKAFLDGTASDWLLMIDVDEQLTTEAFDLLCQSADDKERPVVSALVFATFGVNKHLYPKPVPALFRDTPEGFFPLYEYDRNSLFQVDACGTGCLLIHRSVLQKMREAADRNQGRDWCWFWDGPIDGKWVSEDLLFSRRIRQLGFPIHAHTGAVLPHQKSYWVSEEHYLSWKEVGSPIK